MVRTASTSGLQLLVISGTLLSLASLGFAGALPLIFHDDPLIAEESQHQEQLSIAPFVVTAPMTQQGSERQPETSDEQQELPALAVRHAPQYSGMTASQPAKRHAHQGPVRAVMPQPTHYQHSPATAQASYAPAQQGDLQGSATGYGNQAEGYLDMGAYSSGYGAFGWYADYPVGGGYH
ncbi:uncharacterized protein [Dermacentor andersoni]|uniref:uncharacterized protein n=1 Tax=Dermacentor andersoni TaxID=34620 RepID=UPI0024171217|nr:uncharacterized protein LOC126522190 [Dermacentor andersoni]